MIRISKREAQKCFAADQPIYLCPRKFVPCTPWHVECLILGKEYLEKAEGYRNHPTLWKGTIEATAWALMYNNWAYYNASWEAGYYAHYYKPHNED